MDPKKLEALRARYGGAGATDVHDPEFRKVIDLLFTARSGGPSPTRASPRFLDAPYRPDIAKESAFTALDIP